MASVELDVAVLHETAHRLELRIGERFPGSDLEKRGGDLIGLIERMDTRARQIARPIRSVRALYFLLAVLVILGLSAIPADVIAAPDVDGAEWIPFVESAINDVLLLGAGIVFVITLETRLKRGRTLRELHEVRSFAHVIDMMQLTKDPQRLSRAYQPTSSSATGSITLTPFELGRYLDYCSELLALSSKAAALLAQRFDDPAVLSAVNEVEVLTTGLSRKIWQKLMILVAAHPDATPAVMEQDLTVVSDQ